MQKLLLSFFTVRIALAFALVLLAGCGSSPEVTVSTFPNLPPRTGPADSLLAHTLHRAILESGQFDYGVLRADTELTEYLREIAVTQADAFVSRTAALAFWINAHNACMLDLLRKNEPLSLRIDVSPYRHAAVYPIAGKFYSLYQIEHEVLTTEFKDPRAFFALYFGGRSSTKLWAEPYEDSSLSGQLDRAVTTFIADLKRVSVDRRTHALLLSMLFSDYSNELEHASGSVPAFIKGYATGKLAEFLAGHQNPEIDYLPYDWTQ